MREPNIEAIKKLAILFNISIDYLLGRTPDVFVSEANKETLDMSIMKNLYKLHSRKLDNIKENYINNTTLGTAVNELCCGTGRTTYGESKINTKISMLEIQNLLNDFENSKQPTPQILLKIKDLEKSIIIVEIDSFDDEPMPFFLQLKELLYILQNYHKIIMS